LLDKLCSKTSKRRPIRNKDTPQTKGVEINSKLMISLPTAWNNTIKYSVKLEFPHAKYV